MSHCATCSAEVAEKSRFCSACGARFEPATDRKLAPDATLAERYAVVGWLGAGGMGEVYRARDTRLRREVAVKVLPASFATDADRLRRFEQEARSAGSLSHPNIVAIHDVGTHEGLPYVVSELLEGATLRDRMAGEALPVRRAVDYGLQIARGLSAAHEKGIVHRDLKPENVFVTRDGQVKVLDFGLAKLTGAHTLPEWETESRTLPGSEPGVVLGTVGYMSPEQVRGLPVDHRSDVFSFGATLYEMLTGRRAFRGDSAVETMNAILKAEPPELSEVAAGVPPGLERVVRHCLEKSPEQRFQSARDLAFALEALTDLTTPSAGRLVLPAPRRRRAAPVAAALAVLAAVLLYFITRAREPAVPVFRQITFSRGTILSARFAPDGQNVLYGAAWEGQPFQLFASRTEGPESSRLALPPADLLSVSSSGELALSLGRRHVFGWLTSGTLARVPIAGGAPREVQERIQEADWTPDGSELVVVRRLEGRHRLEFPLGHVVYETAGWISHPRVSPDGQQVAFLDHPVYGDDRGSVALTGRTGRPTVVGESWSTAQGLAWSPRGDEIWFTAAEAGVNSALHALTPSGRHRLLTRAPGRLTLHDVSRQGRLLLARDSSRFGVVVRGPGASAERDLSWLDQSSASDLSEDGKTLLFSEWGEGGGASYGVYLRGTDGSAAVRLGEGQATSLSPDGKWALSIVFGNPPHLALLPTGPGQTRPLASPGLAQIHWARWLRDGQRILISGNEPGRPSRIFLQDVGGGRPRPVTPEGIAFLLPDTPDGEAVLSADAEGRVSLYPFAGGPARPLRGLEPGEVPLRWSADGRHLYVRRRDEPPVRVDRLELRTGARESWLTFTPADPAGILAISSILLTPDGRSYAYTYHRLLSELFLADGLR